MAIGTRTGQGLAVIKYDSRHGRIYLQDRTLVNGSWQSEQRDVTDGFNAIIDIANLQTGWIRFPKGAAPETVLGPIGNKIECPSDDFREGLRVLVKMPGDKAGPRELLSTAAALWAGMDALHDQFLAERAKHAGQVPVCEFVGTREIKNQNGLAHEPLLKIKSWTARPDDLPVTAAPRPQSAPAPKANPKPKRGDMDDEIPF